MTGELLDLIDALIESQVIDSADMAQVTRATPRTVSQWTSANAPLGPDAEDRLVELKSVVDLLRSMLRDKPARLWLPSPNPDLDWRTPLELIAEAEYRRVIGSVLAMAEGVTA